MPASGRGACTLTVSPVRTMRHRKSVGLAGFVLTLVVLLAFGRRNHHDRPSAIKRDGEVSDALRLSIGASHLVQLARRAACTRRRLTCAVSFDQPERTGGVHARRCQVTLLRTLSSSSLVLNTVAEQPLCAHHR